MMFLESSNTTTNGGNEEDEEQSSEWIIGVLLALLATIVGGMSRVAIRKSWLMTAETQSDGLGEDVHPYVQFPSEEEDEQQPPHQQPQQPQQPQQYLDDDDDDDDSENEQLVVQQPYNRNGFSCVSWSWYKRCCSLGKYANRTFMSTIRDAVYLRWIGLFGLMVLDPMMGITAMGFAPPSIVSPTTSLMLVWIVLSTPLLGERPSRWQIVSSSIIIIGEILVAIFGDHTNDDGISVEDVRNSYLTGPTVVFFSLYVGWILFLCTMICSAHRLSSRWASILQRFAWGVIAGSINGLLNFTKDSLIVFKVTLKTVSLWSSPLEFILSLPWFMFVFILVGMTINFGSNMLLSACMKRYDATYSSAMNAGSQILMVSIMSAFHYDTFDNLESTCHRTMYPIGLMILTIGIGMMAMDDNDGRNNEQYHHHQHMDMNEVILETETVQL